jgi:hypothetical protein
MELTNYQIIQMRNRIKIANAQIAHLQEHIVSGGSPTDRTTMEICFILLSAVFEIPHMRKVYSDNGLTPEDLFLVVQTPWKMEIAGELDCGFVNTPDPMPTGCYILINEDRINRLGQLLREAGTPSAKCPTVDLQRVFTPVARTHPERAVDLMEYTIKLSEEVAKELEPQFGRPSMQRSNTGGVKSAMPNGGKGCLSVLALASFSIILILGAIYLP